MIEHNDIIAKELWLRLKDGDARALGSIYDQFIDTLLNYGVSIVPDKELVKDSVQELFINLWNQRKNLTAPNSPKSYLIISLKRTILKNMARENKKGQLHVSYLADFDRHETDMQSRIMADEQKYYAGKLLIQHIDNLSQRQREAIQLRFFEELNYKEISEIMNLNNQGVRNIIYKALQALRKQVVLPQALINFLLL